MGLLDKLLGYGSDEEDYNGELFEIRSKLDEKEDSISRTQKLFTLLQAWSIELEEGNTFSLEIHGLVEDKNNHGPRNILEDEVIIDNPLEGYGTYVFVPEKAKDTGLNVVSNAYGTIPVDIPDGFDTLKVLYENYKDKDECPLYMSCLVPTQPDYYPTLEWGDLHTKTSEQQAWNKYDPFNNILGALDSLSINDFAGVLIVLHQPPEGWEIQGNNRIREIEDETYIANPTILQRLKQYSQGNTIQTGDTTRTAGYKKQILDNIEHDEVSAIERKQSSPLGKYECSIYVYASTQITHDFLCKTLIQNSKSKWNQLQIAQTPPTLSQLANRQVHPQNKMILSLGELANIWHPPDDNNINSLRLHKPVPQISQPPEDIIIVPDKSYGDITYLLKQLLIHAGYH